MRRLVDCVLACALLAGCAAAPPAAPTPFRDPAMTFGAAAGALTAGQTTKAQARALLGEPEAVPFDSGWEVWVYRTRSERAAPQELVLLFDPAGVLTKQRLRSGAVPAAR